ncbi:MAG: CPBP family intramembrane metalloprotease [Chloroflexi bacterium]|nr:CPBP family intramembrane metalloprotease [Chloroflexota bacterium]
MMKYLLGEKLQYDWKVVTVTIISTLLLIIDHYYQITSLKYWDRVILYLLVPLLLILLVFREHPGNFGFSFGDWKLGLTYTAIGILVMAPVIYYLGSGNESMRNYYERFLPGLPWTTFLDLIGWEFLFRGLILFAYARKFGHEALWLQAVPFAIAHISKPAIETLSTVFGGFLFGWVAYRTRSFLWPFLIHWFIATFVIIVAAGAL